MYGTVAREESVELNEHSDRRVIVMIAIPVHSTGTVVLSYHRVPGIHQGDN